MDPTRRTLLTTSAAVAAAAAAQRAFGQTAREQPAADGQFYEKGKTRDSLPRGRGRAFHY